jgi:flagellar biosynthesis protein FliP
MHSRLLARSTVSLAAFPALLLLLLFPDLTWAQGAPLAVITSEPNTGGGQTYSVSLQTLLAFSLLSFLPSLLLLTTGFTRIVIVLSLLRHAIGLQSSPPTQVLVGLAFILNLFVMAPVLDRIYADAYQPYSENKLSFNAAVEKGSAPLRAFMLKQTRESDVALFMKLANQGDIKSKDEIPLRTLIPAFVTSELKTAFQIGFMIFIPFLIIDMVVASVLMSMGMMMLSPVLISLPFKLMLFVLVDGWNLLIGSLMASFNT